MVVELLVCKIDEQLLQRVLFKILEAVNVKDAQESRARHGLLVHQTTVDLRAQVCMGMHVQHVHVHHVDARATPTSRH